MAEHPNVARVRDGYAAFAKGDFAVLTDLFAGDLVWHVGGRSQIAGDYRGREAVFGLFGKIMEVTEGSFRMDPHAVLADDEHAVALVFATASRGGRSITDKTRTFSISVTARWWNSGPPPPISTPSMSSSADRGPVT